MILRPLKQIVIGVIFFSLIGIIVGSIYYFNTPRPTCSDGIKNGIEEGVDCGQLACGLSCPPVIVDLKILSSQIFKIAEGDYDFVAKIYNPNPTYGASKVDSEIIFLDGTDMEVYKSNYDFYILPGQTKYVIFNAIKADPSSTQARIKIKQADWVGIKEFIDVSFPLRNQIFTSQNNRTDFKGVILNDSDFDFDFVEARVILMDSLGNVIGVNKTNLRTLLAGTEREFEVFWPYFMNLSGIKADVEADTNLLDNFNFLRRYGGGQEKFQTYY